MFRREERIVLTGLEGEWLTHMTSGEDGNLFFIHTSKDEAQSGKACLGFQRYSHKG